MNFSHDSEDFKWYVLNVVSGTEAKVISLIKKRMDSAGFSQSEIEEFFIPVKIDDSGDNHVSKNNRKTLAKKDLLVSDSLVDDDSGAKKMPIIQKKVMPGYLFIKMRMNDHLRKAIEAINGVGKFLGDGYPRAIQHEEIEAMRQKITASTNIGEEFMFKIGDSVIISEGPFESFEGLVDYFDHERGKLKVGISIFGRVTVLELDVKQVKKMKNK